MEKFIYPNQPSQCTKVMGIDFTSEYHGGIAGHMSRTRVSAGFNVHGTPFLPINT